MNINLHVFQELYDQFAHRMNYASFAEGYHDFIYLTVLQKVKAEFLHTWNNGLTSPFTLLREMFKLWLEL